MSSMKTIVIVGSINTDLVMRAPRHVRPGETLHADSFEIFTGGKGANQAVAAARLRRTGRTVTVTLPGGDLHIAWRESDDHVRMTGPVAYEFVGRFDPTLFSEPAA